MMLHVLIISASISDIRIFLLSDINIDPKNLISMYIFATFCFTKFKSSLMMPNTFKNDLSFFNTVKPTAY